jgi:hypothetical protein
VTIIVHFDSHIQNKMTVISGGFSYTFEGIIDSVTGGVVTLSLVICG